MPRRRGCQRDRFRIPVLLCVRKWLVRLYGTEWEWLQHTWQAGPHDGDDVGVVDPGLEDQRAYTVDHDDSLLVDGSNCFHEIVSVVPRVEVVAIPCVALDGDVALARISVDAYNRHLRVLSCRSALLGVVISGRRNLCPVSLGLRFDGVQGSDQVLRKD